MENFFNPQPKPARKKSKKNISKARKSYCEYCGKPGQTSAHHIKTVGSGGYDSSENLIALCNVCHQKVHDGNISKEELQEVKEG